MSKGLLCRAGAVVLAALALLLAVAGTASAHPPSDVEPAKGSYEVKVLEAPDGVTADVLQGRVSGLFVRVPAGQGLEVRDAKGGVLARIGSADAASAGTWLDDRLRLPGEPRAEHHRTLVRNWRIPVTYGGEPAEFAGTITWVPTEVPPEVLASSLQQPEAESGPGMWTVVAVSVAALATAFLGYRVWSRRRQSGTNP